MTQRSETPIPQPRPEITNERLENLEWGDVVVSESGTTRLVIKVDKEKDTVNYTVVRKPLNGTQEKEPITAQTLIENKGALKYIINNVVLLNAHALDTIILGMYQQAQREKEYDQREVLLAIIGLLDKGIPPENIQKAFRKKLGLQ